MLQLFVTWVLRYAAHAKNKFVHPWIITCTHSLCHLQNYLQMQNETTNYCCQNFFENHSLTSHHTAAWRNYTGVY